MIDGNLSATAERMGGTVLLGLVLSQYVSKSAKMLCLYPCFFPLFLRRLLQVVHFGAVVVYLVLTRMVALGFHASHRAHAATVGLGEADLSLSYLVFCICDLGRRVRRTCLPAPHLLPSLRKEYDCLFCRCLYMLRGGYSCFASETCQEHCFATYPGKLSCFVCAVLFLGLPIIWSLLAG